MSVRSVTVTIAGQQLTIRTDASDDDLARLTGAVEGKLSAVGAGAGRGVLQVNACLLAALALAQEAEDAVKERDDARREAERLHTLVQGHAQGALEFLDEAGESS